MLATNETLMEVIDAIKNTNTVQKQKEEIQHEGERVLATIPQDYQETVNKVEEMQEAIRDIYTKKPHVNSIGTYFNLRRTGKVYQTKLWKFATNPTSTCEKLLDNANLKFTPPRSSILSAAALGQ